MNKEEELANGILEKLEEMIRATDFTTERIINSMDRTKGKLNEIEKTLLRIEKKRA